MVILLLVMLSLLDRAPAIPINAGARTGKQVLSAITRMLRKYEHENLVKRYIGWRFLSLVLDDDDRCSILCFILIR